MHGGSGAAPGRPAAVAPGDCVAAGVIGLPHFHQAVTLPRRRLSGKNDEGHQQKDDSPMRAIPITALAILATATAGTVQAQEVVTIYSADGLHDGNPSWYGDQFAAFTKATGIKVQYIEDGSGGVVARVSKEKTNPQADVLVTLPPFIQRAGAAGLLQPYTPAGADMVPAAGKDAKGLYIALVNNYLSFIYDSAAMPEPPKTFDDLLAAKFKNKLQYSTPGQAGDGTAVMLQVIHAFGGKDAAFDYFKKLQVNNLGPSASTGKLTALVNKGELWVANGDLQMNTDQMKGNPNIRIFYPAGPNGERSTLALPYYAGIVAGAPHAANGKKLLDWLLSKPAQETVADVALGLPVRSDVKPAGANYENLMKPLNGVKTWTPDWDQVVADFDADVARWHAATGS
jgi:2-aminoethylphosphonate transport system substrate-binding protein